MLYWPTLYLIPLPPFLTHLPPLPYLPSSSIKERDTCSERVRADTGTYPMRADTKPTNGQGGRTSGQSRPSASPPSSSLSASARSVFRVASELLHRIQWGMRAGFRSFRGNRDLYTSLGYLESPTLADYRERYERGGIAGRVIDWLPEMVWGSGIFQVVETTKPDTVSQFESDMEELLGSNLNIQSRIMKADKLASSRQYSVILIGTTDPHLDQPLTRLSGGIKSILYLLQLPQERATITDWIGGSGTEEERLRDRSDPNFGKPKYYELKIGSSASSVSSELIDITSRGVGLTPVKVHYTRILHICPNSLEDDVYGDPGLKRVWNDFDDFYKIKGGGAETEWIQSSLPTLFDLDKDFLVSSGNTPEEDEEVLEELRQEVEAIANKERSYGLTQGVTASPLAGKGRQVNIASNGEFILKIIAGAKKIPFRELIGNQLGLRSSEQDAQMVRGRVDEYVREHADPLLRSLIDRLIQWGVVHKPISGKYKFIWPKIEELNELAKSELAKNYSESNYMNYQAGLKPNILPDEVRDKLELDPLEKQALLKNMLGSDSGSGPIEDITTNTSNEPMDSPFTVSSAHTLSSTQIDIPQPYRDQILNIGLNIPDGDLGVEGRELNPHITIKYGIESDNPDLVRTLIEGFGPITFTLADTAVFESDEYDVLYIEVDPINSGDLDNLNVLISSSLKVTDTHPEYIPHITIAYLKPGLGKNYIRDSSMNGVKITTSMIVFSSLDGTTTEISTLKL